MTNDQGLLLPTTGCVLIMITASSWCKSTRCKGCSGQIVALRSRIIVRIMGRIERIMGSLKRIIGKDLENRRIE